VLPLERCAVAPVVFGPTDLAWGQSYAVQPLGARAPPRLV
jgi:hypothetical protein